MLPTVVVIEEHLDDGGESPFAAWFDRLVILLAGGSKRRQAEDIAAAKTRWREYRDRKKGSA